MADDGLEGSVRRADPARWLSSRLAADPQARADVVALYAYDLELERATRVASTPLLAEIRLSWWREALDEIFENRPVRAHPVARALSDVVARRRLPRPPLRALIDARIDSLGAERVDGTAADARAEGVGGSAAILAARILDPDAPSEAAAPAGRAWELFRLHRGGTIDAAEGRAWIASALKTASSATATLSAAAFPAVAHATLIRAAWRSDGQPGLEARARLFWASLTGRL